MNKVTCYYFSGANGRMPAKEFIDSLSVKTQAKFSFAKALLEAFGHRLPQPHAKYIGDDLFELRFSGEEGALRVLYFFFHRDKAVFTNGFLKKKNKTPRGEKRLAIERRKAFLAGQA